MRGTCFEFNYQEYQRSPVDVLFKSTPLEAQSDKYDFYTLHHEEILIPKTNVYASTPSTRL
jgi:hypothetical protein